MFRHFVRGFEMGLKAWHARNSETETVLVAQAEVVGGAFLDGFDSALAFASEVAARAADALT